MNTSNYPLLLNKLDAFVRKYYKNQLLRGAIYFALATLFSFLLVVLLEYFGHYNTLVRATLFYCFLLFVGFCLVKYVISPLLGMYKLGKTLSYEYASTLIGIHFPDVKDKLLNTLQLKHEAEQKDSALLEAAISQKAEQLKPIVFTDAINLKQNLKHARIVIIPAVIYLVIYLFAPGIITKGSERLIKYNTTFLPEAPFAFELQNNKLTTAQYTDFELTVTLKGKAIPNEVYVDLNGQSFKMQKVDKTTFTYTLRNVNKDVPFHFSAADFNSTDYLLKVIAKPVLINYSVKLQYPGYIGKQAEVLQNPGDLTLPAGTVATWILSTSQTDFVEYGFGEAVAKADRKNDVQFTFSKKLLSSSPYFIRNKNHAYGIADSLAYMINVLPDAFPQISVEEQADSISGKQLYFIGDASDDYGLTKLVFAYRFLKSENASKVKQGIVNKPIALQRDEKTQRFYFQFNLNETGLNAADELEYYFEVWDNDGVHGAKSAKSKTMVFKAPSEKELRNELSESGKSLKADMQSAINESKKLQKELKDLQLKMLEKKELTWEEKKKAEELLKRQKELNEKLEDVKKQLEKKNQKENEYKELTPELLEKQQQLEKMFNELMSEEMKKLLKDLDKMLQQQNKDAVKQEMEKMQLNNKDVEKELDRMLEQFKQLELDKKLTDVTEQLQKTADKQKELARKTEQLENNKSLNKEEKQQQQEQLKQEQQQLNEAFKDAQKQLREIEKTNKELEDPRELENTKQQEDKISKEQQDASDKLDKKENKNAAEKQENAAEEMEKMAEKIKEKQEEEEKEQHEEDAEALREILENTIQLSKDQENLIDGMKKITGYSPEYVELAKKQKTTRDNAKIIEDSLLALSKRVPEISSFINREITKLNDNLDKSITAYAQRNYMEIRTRQQYTMTHANNLAVMLSEVLNQMQQQNQQAQSKKSGKGKGKPKPGQGKGNGKPLTMGQIKKMQEELNKQLREGMNKQGDQGKPQDQGGQKPGGQKPGGQQPGGQLPGGMSSEGFARMAAQQMAIRQQMQKMMQQMDAKQKEGLGGSKLLEEMKQMMEKTEKELFNKQLTSEMLMRQQEILTRLLESEKAERKQEQEEKREAEQGKERPKVSPPQFDLYIQQKNKEKELLETIPAEMQPYYKEKSKAYFNKLGDKR